MAFDKVVDSSVLDAGLKTIADAIRAKGGTSDALAFPEGFAEAIAAIEKGAELSVNTFTFDSDTLVRDTPIYHNAGFIPDIAFVFASTPTVNTGVKGKVIFWLATSNTALVGNNTFTNQCVFYTSASSISCRVDDAALNTRLNESYVQAYINNSIPVYLAGVTYYCLVAKVWR